MFEQKNAVWQRDICKVSENIHVRVWHSNRVKNTWQIFLLWQNTPGEPRIKIYTRYITADDLYSARKGAFAVITRWLKKQTRPHPSLYKEMWNSILEAFGLPPV